MKILCDNCKKEFEVGKLQNRKLAKDIELTYFICPHCKTEFTAYYTNRQIRVNQSKIREMAVKIKTLKGEKSIQLHEEMEKLIKFNKEKMQELRKGHEA